MIAKPNQFQDVSETTSTTPITLDNEGRRSFKRGLDKLQRSHVREKLLGHLTIFNKSQDNTVSTNSKADANDHFSSSDVTEDAATLFDSDTASSMSAESSSFSLGDTPVSKTKRFNNGLHFLIDKIHFYHKHKRFYIFGTLKNDFSDNYQEQNNYQQENPDEYLSDDAFSCYNQFRTENFSAFFDRVTDHTIPENRDKNEVSVPVFSPINELAYQDLEKLKQQVFGVPQFSTESLVDFLGVHSKQEDECVDDNVTQLCDSDDTTHAESDSVKTSGSTPEIIKQLFNDSIQSADLFEIDSSQVHKIDQMSSSNLDGESMLTPINPSSPSTLQRTRSLLDKMKSVFRMDHTSGISSRSTSTSTYSPVSIVVPALENHSFIVDLAEHVSEGNIIEPIYHPDDVYSYFTEDENTPIDIKNPSFYDLPSQINQNMALSSAQSNLSVMTTIKFDKFAQLLFYDGSKRLRYVKDKNKQHSTKKSSKRQELFKNKGSLVLSSNTSMKFKVSKLSKLSKFATISSQSQLDRMEAQGFQDTGPSSALSSLAVKPILKSKLNKNAEAETVRARYCDDVAVDDFMTFFENHEKNRQDSEPFLEKVREKQLMKYYSVDESLGSWD